MLGGGGVQKGGYCGDIFHISIYHLKFLHEKHFLKLRLWNFNVGVTRKISKYTRNIVNPTCVKDCTNHECTRAFSFVIVRLIKSDVTDQA